MSDQNPNDQSPRLGLPYVRAGQLQKHVTVNEGLTRLDSLVQTAIRSRSLSAPPQMVEEGDSYILANAPSGGWAGFTAGQMVVADIGGWRVFEPSEGQLAVILDEGAAVFWRESQWVPLSQILDGVLKVQRLGVGADPDAANPFSARLNKALWTAMPTSDGGDGDLRFTFNKQASANTASLLFQSNWQGRAELGLAGDDDLRLKVSANGSSWQEVFRADAVDGRLWFSRGATRRESQAYTTETTLVLPDWVRWVEATCIGGGGGGGVGASGAAGSLRLGGGGGGAGGYCTGLWSREHLGANLTITVGGAGGGGSGGNGFNGAASTILTHGQVILRATGGSGGQAGGLGGLGGAGGTGFITANAGGNCEGAVAFSGQSLACPHGPGGGGAGGGLGADNSPHSGGIGGAGGQASVLAQGGSSSLTGSGMGAAAPLVYLSRVGGGGGGGASRTTGGGYVGSAAGANGGGGGGGGASTTVGGSGGAGSAGVVVVTLVG